MQTRAESKYKNVIITKDLTPLQRTERVGTETVHRQDSSPTHILETVHDKIGDSSPTY